MRFGIADKQHAGAALPGFEGQTDEGLDPFLAQGGVEQWVIPFQVVRYQGHASPVNAHGGTAGAGWGYIFLQLPVSSYPQVKLQMSLLIKQVDHSRVRSSGLDHLPGHQLEGLFQTQRLIDLEAQLIQTSEPRCQLLRLLVQPRVLNGDSGLVGEERGQPDIVLVEFSRAGKLNESHNSDDSLTVLKRYTNVGGDRLSLPGRRPPLPMMVVIHDQRFAALEHLATNPLAGRQTQAGVVPREAVANDQFEVAFGLINEIDTSRSDVQQTAALLQNALQEFVKFQLIADRQGDLSQCPQILTPALDPRYQLLRLLVQPRVLDGDSGMAGKGFQTLCIGGAELSGPGAVRVQKADGHALRLDGCSNVGAPPFLARLHHPIGGGGCVGDEDGFSTLYHLYEVGVPGKGNGETGDLFLNAQAFVSLPADRSHGIPL